MSSPGWEGDVPELSVAGRHALRQVEPLSGTPRGPPFTAVGVLHERPPRTPVSWS